MSALLNTTFMAAAFLGLFGLGEFLYHWIRLKAELTRKVIHVGTGLLVMLFPAVVENPGYVALLCASFLVILLASSRWRLLPSINGVKRITYGSYLYPIIVAVCYYLAYRQHDLKLFYLPVLTLAFCDPMAELCGKKWPFGKYSVFGGTKTLVGSIGFFLSSLVVSLMTSLWIGDFTPSEFLIWAPLLALCTCIAEGLSTKGWDNLTIPFSASLFLMFV